MNSLNSVLLEGNVTADLMLSLTPKGTEVTDFNIGNNRYYIMDGKHRNEVSFFNIEAWGKLAQKCAERLKKGTRVRVVGRLKQNRWTDENGNFRDRITVVAEHVELAPPPKNLDQAVTDICESADAD